MSEPAHAIGPGELVEAMRSYRDLLASHRDAINRLNVYPVPDGDTGTNMFLTLESVVSELDQLEVGSQEPGAPAPTMPDVCRAIAHGSLMGARGNSGVILCQLLRGLTGVLSDASPAGPEELSAALAAASEAAHEAVLRPVEGTILTVARAAAEGAAESVSAMHGSEEESRCVACVLDGARDAAAGALARTPEMLPVLARAGVVDAGGTGYLLMLDALLHVVAGRELPAAPELAGASDAGMAGVTDGGSPGALEGGAQGGADRPVSELRYEVMYFLEAPDETMPAFKEVWAGIGDSIVVVGGDGLWNCHIHTDDVGAAIEAAIDVGRPRDIRVTDLADQVEEERWVTEQSGSPGPAEPEEAGPVHRTSVVAVANGDGIARIFRSLGVHHFVAGGQSMNPSTAEILEVVEAVSSPEVVILPNNGNIVPVAMQVAELSTKVVRVVPTGGIVEGFAALLEYDPEAGAEGNAGAMAGSARRVVAGEVTRAVRDAEGPTGPIREGDWLGVSREGVEVVEGTLHEAVTALLDHLVGPEHELVTLIEGEGASAGDTRRVAAWLADEHPGVHLEVHHGGQPLYPYLISIE